MALRQATQADLEEIIDLFSNTVRTVNTKDYSEEQIEVWASARNKEAWSNKIKDQYFLVKELDRQIVGFSSIDPTGYLDFMYVHADYQGKGIARELLTAILAKAKSQQNKRVWTSVSITAQPFFQRAGFEMVEEERKEVNGVEFVNAIMEKWLE